MAIIVDFLILGIPKLVISALIVSAADANGFITASFALSSVVIGLIFVAIDIAYFAFMNGSGSGQTIGQILLGIAVRDIDTGGPIDPGRAAKRILVLDPSMALAWIPVLSAVALLYTVIAAVSPLWDQRRRGFHDLVARTTVVRVR